MAKGELAVRVTANTKEYDESLKKLTAEADKAKKKLDASNSSVRQIGRSIKTDVAGALSTATEKAGGLGKGFAEVFKGGLSPLSIFTAALAAVGGVFTNLMSKSQAFGDAIQRLTSKAGAALSYAFDPTNWGSGFLEGLEKVWNAAGELADAADSVGTHLIEWQAKEARLNDTLADSQAILADQTATAEQRAEAVRKAQAAADEYEASAKKLNDARRQELELQVRQTALNSQIALSQEEINYVIEKGIEDVDAMVAAGGNLARFADAMSDETHQKLVRTRSEINQLDRASSDFAKRVAALTRRDTRLTAAAAVKIEPTIPAGSFADIKRKISDFQKRLEFTIPASLDAYKIKTEIDILKEQLEGKGDTLISIKPELDVSKVDLKDLKLINKEGEALLSWGEEVEKIGGVFGALGSMVSAVGDESKEAAVGVQALAIAQQVAAMASAIYNASQGDPYTTAARIIAAAAAVTSSVVAIQKLSRQNFTAGGVVQGQFESGDRQIIGVNAGEMVLNKRQQGALFNLLDKGTVGGHDGGVVTFRIEGRDLVGVLDAYNRYNMRSV